MLQCIFLYRLSMYRILTRSSVVLAVFIGMGVISYGHFKFMYFVAAQSSSRSLVVGRSVRPSVVGK